MSELEQKRELYDLAKTKYYNGNSIITDSEFDELEEWLVENDDEFVPYVGEKTSSNKETKFKHYSPMLSLSKISIKVDDDGDEIFDLFSSEFTNWTKDMPIESTYLWTPKFDGCSVNLQYSKGKLIRAITRGNKIEGRDVLNRIVNAVPKTLKTDYKKLDKLEIRGEIILSKEIFDSKYSSFKNPRNLVAGFLSQKDIDKNISKDLTFIPFDIRHYSNDIMFHENLQDEDNIKKLITEFPSAKEEISSFKIFSNELDAYEFYKNYRKSSRFNLDGIVVSINSDNKETTGYSDSSPKWAKAIKFPPKTTQTTIIDIVWSLGKTGEFTPIGKLQPIELDGTIVSNVSLYNFGSVKNSGLSIGAEISLEKAGDIIPRVKKIISKSENEFEYPIECPFCNENTKVDDIHLLCVNPDCNGVLEKKFLYNTNLLKIDFLGEETSKKLFQSGLFKNVYDLIVNFNNRKQELLNNNILPNGKIIESLSKSFNIKEMKIERVIELLGEDGLGSRMSKQLANYYSNIDYDFSGFERRIIHKYTTSDNELINCINFLKNNGIEIIYNKEEGKYLIVELTGSPKSFGYKTKEEYLLQISNSGYKAGELKKGTFALITDDKTSESNKMKKANKLNVPIYDYSEFIEKFIK